MTPLAIFACVAVPLLCFSGGYLMGRDGLAATRLTCEYKIADLDEAVDRVRTISKIRLAKISQLETQIDLLKCSRANLMEEVRQLIKREETDARWG